jgi:hypothetical protein
VSSTKKTKPKTAPKRAPAAKVAPASLAERLLGVSIPADAWALSQVEPGVGITPHIDKLLALGFPNMVSVVDGPLPSTDRKKALKTFDISRVVTREMLPRLYAYERAETEEDRDAAFAIEPAPFELASVVKDELSERGWNRVWMLEAMFGSEPVAEAFVASYLELPTEEWFDSPIGSWGDAVLSGLGMVLNRTSADTRGRLRGQLESLYQRLREVDGRSVARKRLDVILHGRAGLERSGKRGTGRYFTTDYHWARDDRSWIEEKVLAAASKWTNRDRIWFDAQLAFTGGARVLARLREVSLANIVMADHRKAVSEQLALFA